MTIIKKYDLQIEQYNIYHINIISMKNIIAMAKKYRKNEEPLAMETIDKIGKAEVVKMSTIIDLHSKYSQAISDVDKKAARDLGLIGIKKYQRYVSQI